MSVDEDSWAAGYDALIAGLPALARAAAPTLCGMSACVDARVDMHAMPALLQSPDPEAQRFAAMLVDRAAHGVGGEVRVEWPEGPAWLAAHLAVRYALGGTGPQAAWVLDTLGAPAVLALEDRCRHMLDQVPTGILLVEDGRLVPAGEARPHGGRRPDIFIFEYTAGRPVGSVLPTRSSRIIVRFSDSGIEEDLGFDRLTPDLAASAGAGLVAGFSCEPRDRLDAATDRVFALTRAWRRAGLETVHLELAGYATEEALQHVLQACPGAVTSLGMSHSELLALDPGAEDPMDALLALAERLDLARVCAHADHWAAAVTRDDPERERQALMTGCLLAAARAAAGRPVASVELDPEARFQPLPFPAPRRRGPWSFVACASPHLERPATTLGLGDSFAAGCLLALGRPARPAKTASAA